MRHTCDGTCLLTNDNTVILPPLHRALEFTSSWERMESSWSPFMWELPFHITFGDKPFSLALIHLVVPSSGSRIEFLGGPLSRVHDPLIRSGLRFDFLDRI